MLVFGQNRGRLAYSTVALAAFVAKPGTAFTALCTEPLYLETSNLDFSSHMRFFRCLAAEVNARDVFFGMLRSDAMKGQPKSTVVFVTRVGTTLLNRCVSKTRQYEILVYVGQTMLATAIKTRDLEQIGRAHV